MEKGAIRADKQGARRLVGMLGVLWLVATLITGGGGVASASPGSQTWYLDSDGHWFGTDDLVMYQNDLTEPEGHVDIADNSYKVWFADRRAQVTVAFPAGWWHVRIVGAVVPVTDHYYGETVSISFGHGYPGGPPVSGVSRPGSLGREFDGIAPAYELGQASEFPETWEKDINLPAFQCPANRFLAIEIRDKGEVIGMHPRVFTGGEYLSYVQSPSSDPGYPVLEVSTVVLLTAGLVFLGGYCVLKRRTKVIS